MSMVLSFLQFVGWILCLLLILVFFMLALILLVPIRYRGEFSIKDPETHEKSDWVHVKERAAGTLTCSWLFSLVRGQFQWQDDPALQLRIAWVHLDTASLTAGRAGGNHKNAAAKEPQQGICDRIKRIWRKADYYNRVLHKTETTYSLQRLHQILMRFLKRILPQQWEIRGTVGLGDPAATAQILELEGMLYPILTGHIGILPVFDGWQLDLAGTMKGHIRVIHLLFAILSVLSDSRIRKTLRRFKNADRNIALHYSHTDQVSRTV